MIATTRPLTNGEEMLMAQFFALLSVVLMIPVVLLFDWAHQRKRNYRRLWEMYEGLKALRGSR